MLVRQIALTCSLLVLVCLFANWNSPFANIQSIGSFLGKPAGRQLLEVEADAPLTPSRAPLVKRSQLPLHTSSRWIVDKSGKRVKWSCVNWSGGEEKDGVPGGLQHQPAENIAATFASMGFNCVRLLWSVQMALKPHKVDTDKLLAANPQMKGHSTLQILDEVVNALVKVKLMVIMDNHMSDPDWCCSDDDENGLWYNERWSEQQWIDSHKLIAKRYAHHPYVVGQELRNEIRSATFGNKTYNPTWGSGHPKTDWRLAAEKAAAAILSVRPELLIAVDGLNYATDFSDFAAHPMRMPIPGRLVYSSHDYGWSQDAPTKDKLYKLLDEQWGYLITEGKKYTAPVWVSEWGDAHDGSDFKKGWWPWFNSYLADHDFDFSYWRGDGTESRGTGRDFGAEAPFGVMNTKWSGPAKGGKLLRWLQKLQAPTMGPLAI
eukprot:TRINITY_DN21536_c0_g1_i1.p1 TRINITY_DN21536_c0_g1~~TRINITY_DN21536_c0_g1_i1.p1  ORF type:complete len:432 (-),score=64.34 TRINITY_DN21536_c0_g1_i1:214-1509(-)